MLYFWQFMELTREFFEKMPKAEVHLHIDGAIPVGDILRIKDELGITLPHVPEQTPDAIRNFYLADQNVKLDTPEKFDRFLKKFQMVIALMKTPEGIQKVVRAFVRNLAQQNYVYAEARFAPQYHTDEGLTLQDVIGNALDALGEARRETGTLVKLIISIGRECSSEESQEIAQATLAFQNDGVVALDLACNEEAYPPENHKDAYALTFNSDLKRTVHAGEFPVDLDTRVKNIRTALVDLSADGLGHAIGLGYVTHEDSRYVTELVLSKGVRIEACPLSNQLTGAIDGDFRDLGLGQLLRRSALVSLNSDDPAIFGTSLADVYEKVCETTGFGIYRVMQLMRNAVTGAFCSEEERAWIFGEFEKRGMKL